MIDAVPHSDLLLAWLGAEPSPAGEPDRRLAALCMVRRRAGSKGVLLSTGAAA